jgi:hypothetical protein
MYGPLNAVDGYGKPVVSVNPLGKDEGIFLAMI